MIITKLVFLALGLDLAYGTLTPNPDPSTCTFMNGFTSPVEFSPNPTTPGCNYNLKSYLFI